MFGEKYYDQEEEDVDEIAQKGIDINLMKDVDGEPDEVDIEAYERSLAGPLKERAIKKTTEKMEEDGFNLWFVCDGCMKPIPEEMFRFDCTQCDNFTFCHKCYKKNSTHLHKF